MKIHLIVGLILIGLTLMFNADTRKGIVYVNSAGRHLTIIYQPSTNSAWEFDSVGNSRQVSYQRAMSDWKDANQSGNTTADMAAATCAVIVPVP